jgi:hypothetical protein
MCILSHFKFSEFRRKVTKTGPPKDGIYLLQFQKSDISALASKTKNGAIVMFWNYHDDDKL